MNLMINQTLNAIIVLFVLCNSIFAQRTDSIRSATWHKITSTFPYVPTLLVAGGIAVNGNGEEGIKKEIAEELHEQLPTFNTHLDNYLQYSPIAIAYGLDAFGYKSETDISNRTAILLKGELFMIVTVFSTKQLTHQLRPDNSGHNSFPSGHTAQAFAAATFLSEEYKDQFKWIPYLAYGTASSVGLLRMAKNKHYISDVLVGAGLGILSMKISYLTHQYKWGKKHRTAPLF
ncbi:MAG: phosphatase PAP2 family protein [Saprospiraceae bacterium]